MLPQVRKIELGKEFKSDSIGDFKHINIFIGENNSGKSRTIREILKKIAYQGSDIYENYKNIEYTLSFLAPVLKETSQKLNNFLTSYPSLHANVRYSILKGEQIDQTGAYDIVQRKLEEFERVLKEYGESNSYVMVIETLKNIGEFSIKVDRSIPATGDIKRAEDSAIYFNQKYKDVMNSIKLPELVNNTVYIPVLRNIRKEIAEKSGKKDIFKEIIEEEYFAGKSKTEIFTGNTLYTRIKGSLLGTQEKRDKIKDYQEFLGRVYFETSIELIPEYDEAMEKEKLLKIRFGNYDEKYIHELGDGLQSLIIFTYPCYMNDESYIFIEEPELYLHPGMMRRFVKSIHENEILRRHQYFFATHSNNLLEVLLDYDDVAIFLVEKEENKDKNGFDIKVTEQLEANRQILDAIGVRDSSVFFSNAKIWVEGITDIRYLRKYLEIYIKQHRLSLREDVHYSFIEYGGANLKHFEFSEASNGDISVKKFAHNNIVIADGDKENGKTVKNIKKILQNNLIITDGKEIENTLTRDVIGRTIKEYIKCKNFNINEIEEIGDKYQRDKEHSLGYYIDEDWNLELERKFSKNNTVSDKKEFCDKAIQVMDMNPDIDLLSKSALSIIEKVINFIQEANK